MDPTLTLEVRCGTFSVVICLKQERRRKHIYIYMLTAKKPNVSLDYVTWNAFFHFDLQKLSSHLIHTMRSSIAMRVLIT